MIPGCQWPGIWKIETVLVFGGAFGYLSRGEAPQKLPVVSHLILKELKKK